LNLEKDTTEKMIERAHRGGKEKMKNGKPSQPIFVKFNHWKNAQRILRRFTQVNIENKSMGIKVDQMYSEETINRRHEALMERKKLLLNKENNIAKAHIQYPARLMIKKLNSTKYSTQRILKNSMS
jgi:hypothetical protein